MTAAGQPDESETEASVEYRVPEMDCPSCAEKIERSVSSLEGVREIDAHVTSGRLVVRYDDGVVDESAVRERIEAVGYEVDGDATELAFSVPEMDCAGCAATVERALEATPAVETVETQPAVGRVTVTVSEGADPDDLTGAIAEAGYTATPVSDSREPLVPVSVWRSRRAVATAIGALALAGGLLVQFGLSHLNPTLASLGWVEFTPAGTLFVLSAALAGVPILRNGYYSARTHSLDIDVLMSAGIVASVAANHPKEGALLAVLFSIAQLLERSSMDRARESLRELMELSPKTARVRRDEGVETVPVADLMVGDVVLVRPGEKIPADGIVRDGASAIDQSPITGESVPAEKGPGDDVYAGTITESGYLEVEVTCDAGESTIDRIISLVEDAERNRTRREQFVDRFASVYTPIVVVLAVSLAVVPPLALGWSWSTWFLRGLTLLVIACPCAFVISTPVSVVSGITSAARNGVLIKGGRHLETVGDADVLALDKTGTITTGELTVTDVIALDGADESAILERASAVERRSEHPIARAIVDRAESADLDTDAIEITGFDALAGRGVRADLDGQTHYVGKPDLFEEATSVDLHHRHATDGGLAVGTHTGCEQSGCVDVLKEVVPRLEADGKTVVLVGTDERILGVLAIADRVRSDATWAISRLQELGVEVVMLTGDNEGTARAIAREVGIEKYHAELLPEEKLEWIDRLERRGEPGEHRHVAMVGDGINDAPAMATASVGIAMGAAGTDTAIETADVALMGDDLTRLPYLFRLSRAANGVIKQNIGSSLAVKAVLAAGAPFGLVTVIHAVVIGDMGMSLGVTGNAMRLAGIEPDTPDGGDSSQ